MKPILPFLEVMATQACNLSCLGCTNYSDLPLKGFLSWDDARKMIEPWVQRIEMPDFSVIGGEPLLNPTIKDWVIGLRDLLPNSRLRLTTNGLLLHKKLDIVDLMHDIGNSLFKITVHCEDEKLNNSIEEIFNRFKWTKTQEFGLTRWVTSNGFKLQINRPTQFVKTYVGEYINMMPHNSNPVDAYKICSQPNCPLLYNGKIYKCSTSALLADTLNHVGNPNFEMWKPYLSNGIGIDCSQEELVQFVNNHGKPNTICRMCPTVNDVDSCVDHLKNVSRKKYKINEKSG